MTTTACISWRCSWSPSWCRSRSRRQPGGKAVRSEGSDDPGEGAEDQHARPAGFPVINLALEGSPLVVRASLNGKSVRRALKVIVEHGPDNVNVVLQGNLKPATTPGGPFLLDGAGLAATPKIAKAEPGGGVP